MVNPIFSGIPERPLIHQPGLARHALLSQQFFHSSAALLILFFSNSEFPLGMVTD